LIYFPRVVIPFSVILARLLNFLISSAILAGLMLFYRIPIHKTIILAPLIMIVQFFFIAGLSLFLSVGHLFYRDVGYIVNGVLPLFMFVTSVVYPIKLNSPALQKMITMFNPMIPIIESYRDVLLRGKWPDFSLFAMPFCLCFSLFILGLIFFTKMENLFAENV
jgi:ABC-2 type transport system permease protein